MNPRIKELLDEAGIKFDLDLNKIDVCVLLPSDLSKFADLIVGECLNVVDNIYHRTPLELCGPLLNTGSEISKLFGEEK
jgi:hypothetical protein